MPDPIEWLTVPQARKRLGGCSRSYLYELMRRGLLESVNPGGRRRLITSRSIDGLLEAFRARLESEQKLLARPARAAAALAPAVAPAGRVLCLECGASTPSRLRTLGNTLQRLKAERRAGAGKRKARGKGRARA